MDDPQLQESARKTAEQAPEALPELVLKQLQRSEQPIDQESGNKRKIEVVQPWKNYTLVTLEGVRDIRIFDEDSRRYPEFSLPSSDTTISVTFSSEIVKNKINRNYITEDLRNQRGDMVSIDKVPLELRAHAQKHLNTMQGSSPKNFSVYYANTAIKMTASNCTIVSDKYIVFTSQEGAFFAFETQTNSGLTLAPKDWKRIDPADPMPEELRKEAEKLLKGTEGYTVINESYFTLVNDVSINVMRTGDPQGRPAFTETIPSVERNVVTDRTNSNVLYYCQSSNPKEIRRLDVSGEPPWQSVPAPFPKRYESISNLQLDPTGNFFLFYNKDELVMVTKETLEEVASVSDLTQVNFDSNCNIRAVDKDGHLVILEANFDEVTRELDKRRAARLVQGINVKGIFDAVAEKHKAVSESVSLIPLEILELAQRFEQELNQTLASVTTQEGLDAIRTGLVKIQSTLLHQGLKPLESTYILNHLEESVQVKEAEFATNQAETVLQTVRDGLGSGLSIASVVELQAALDTLKPTKALLTDTVRHEYEELTQRFTKETRELYRGRDEEIVQDVQELVAQTRTELEGFESKAQMDSWLDSTYYQKKASLGYWSNNVRADAHQVHKSIHDAMKELQTLSDTYERKFKEQYAHIREKATERISETVTLLSRDIDAFVARLHHQGFTDRRSAQVFVATSPARKFLEDAIVLLADSSPDKAQDLERSLKISIANAYTEIERMALTQVALTGQQVEPFGQTYFPRWEAKVKEKVQRTVDLTWVQDERSHGPGVGATGVFGDVALYVRGSTGKVTQVRLFQGLPSEAEWRYGTMSYRGKEIPPSYITAEAFRAVRKDYTDWSKGDQSTVRKQLQEKRDLLKEVYAQRQPVGARTADVDGAWQEAYKQALDAYGSFAATHHISLLRRIDQIKAEPEVAYANGSGYVPKWQNAWVRDEQTEQYLEEIALFSKKQLETKTGLLMLRGHAGSGKDVLVDMFCQATKRPKFTFNCTKWTAEADLSEDWTLEAQGGATQAIKIPSALLAGIQTPGAVIYLNEFSAMPIPAQLFLHSLADAKREMVLKSESGKIIKAQPTVLLMASENPGYPETFKPQYATESRFDIIEVEYPPLEKKADPSDPNQQNLITSSEASRIARSVSSLLDFTLEKGLRRSTFDDVWDSYVNGIQNSAPELTPTQKFDLDVILAVVQFSDKLREAFTHIFDKTRDASKFLKDLPAVQPVTGREMLSCAWWLGSMPESDKATANPDKVAREFLEKSYLRHIQDREQRRKVRQAMDIWTSKKRVRV